MTAPLRPQPGTRADLLARSVAVLLDGQVAGGAYLAAPAFSQYGHCWLRDGAFIAHALDRVGEHASAAAFHGWVARTVMRYGHKVERLESRSRRDGQRFGDEEILHTRFTAKGGELAEDWGNFQLDGYGFWLASLARHVALAGAGAVARDGATPCAEAVDLVVRYLALLWDRPCYDCWEEYPARRHSATWAAVAAGLEAGATLLGREGPAAVARTVLDRLRAEGTRDGVLLKFADEACAAATAPRDGQQAPARAVAGHERAGKPLPAGAIDGSALLATGPLGPFAPEDPLVGPTVRAVEEQLVAEGGGVHRYAEDEYYGGGLWVLLSCALADMAARLGDTGRARAVLDWVDAQADGEGLLPEQVSRHLRHPQLLEPWRERWGGPARPLVWSHAMYVIARTSLASGRPT